MSLPTKNATIPDAEAARVALERMLAVNWRV